MNFFKNLFRKKSQAKIIPFAADDNLTQEQRNQIEKIKDYYERCREKWPKGDWSEEFEILKEREKEAIKKVTEIK